VMHENSEKKNDRQWNADQPKQCASSKTHVSLLLIKRLCLDEGKSSNRGAKKRRTYSNPPSRKIRRRLLDVFFSILLGEIALGLEPELQLHSFRSPACFPEFIGAKSYRFQVQLFGHSSFLCLT